MAKEKTFNVCIDPIHKILKQSFKNYVGFRFKFIFYKFKQSEVRFSTIDFIERLVLKVYVDDSFPLVSYDYFS